MTVGVANAIEARGIKIGSNFVVSTVPDSWNLGNEHNHLLALQSKLNAYFGFIETGHLLESYPKAAGRQIVIDVVGRFSLPQIAIDFLHRASDTCSVLNAKIRYRHQP